ncbi:pilus assembly protein CpaE [Parasphingopyxis lamellibrachiae]|uniref:Pilus assembly protein CpaE n=1 Tax=Parasphingopyxis lamellibrachiae TaxID=680125 RepID=A0A3D9FC08_9SPHN|nr:pilus assembly protein CpaE [Parasphingopyxis lamellibrachiae]RED15263.1 pilus assembly protein CpaE [Parasphingopyxis lamellibrachiae]
MNAPFNSGSAGLREPFQAYVCDEETAEMLKPVVTELGWAQEKVNKGGLQNAVQSLSVSASPNILFVDLSESSDPLNDINNLAEVCEPGTVVIASGQVNDVRLYRDLLTSGIQDYLLKPFSADQLRDTLTQAQMVLAGPRNADGDEQDRPHVMTAFIGTRGGVGASTLASSVAWQLSAQQGRLTALLDLDIHFGTDALALDLEPGRGLIDAIENPSRIDGLFIERAMVKANEKLAVLSAEAPINQPMLTDGSAYYQLEEELRSAFELSVIDIPRQTLIQYPHLLNEVNRAVVVTELTLAATRDTIRLLSWFKSNAPQCQVILVANRVPAGGALEISKKDFETSVERKIDMVIPFDQKTAVQAAKLGKTLAEASGSGKTGSLLKQLAEQVSSLDGEDRDAETVAGGSLMDKLGSFKSLISKNPGKKKTVDA